MKQLRALIVVSVLALVATVAPRAQSSAADVQVQFADLLFADGRYDEAADAYRRARQAPDHAIAARAGAGLVLSLLRVAELQEALRHASDLQRTFPSHVALAALRGDALWSMGRFEDAEAAYEQALAIEPRAPRARHGRARSLDARNRLTDALAESLEAVALNPREGEFHHTLASIYERLRRFDEAASALDSLHTHTRRRAESAGAERAARVPAGRHCRPPFPEPLPPHNRRGAEPRRVGIELTKRTLPASTHRTGASAMIDA